MNAQSGTILDVKDQLEAFRRCFDRISYVKNCRSFQPMALAKIYVLKEYCGCSENRKGYWGQCILLQVNLFFSSSSVFLIGHKEFPPTARRILTWARTDVYFVPKIGQDQRLLMTAPGATCLNKFLNAAVIIGFMLCCCVRRGGQMD